MKQIIYLSMLLFSFCAANAQVSNVHASFSCEDGITIVYNLNSSTPVDILVSYSRDRINYYPCTTVTGDLFNQTSGDKAVTWNLRADGFRVGGFVFRVEIKKECIDINGVCWATRNVDAPGTFAATPEDAGMFYQWNSNIGWSATGTAVPSDGTSIWNSAWNGNNATTWETTNNVCPTGWRVPTHAEQESLANTGSVWTTPNGVTGRLFGTAPNTIFLPAAGYRNINNGTLYNVGTFGDYWSSTANSPNSYFLHFRNSGVYPSSDGNRATGYSVRCVAD
jgi:uncharacterized protein (TIGR02145 family)